MRLRRAKPKLVLPPDLPRGETEFEEKRIATEFELVFKQISHMGLASLKDTYEFAFRAGIVTGKLTARLKEKRDEGTTREDREQRDLSSDQA